MIKLVRKSFRGKDTRKTFVDHLYYALQQHGILTYKDDEMLDRGDTIGPSLFEAIEESWILVIIFSENYADSSWCLDELSHIMDCKDSETGQIVFPIFYNVDPSDVRKQKRKYGEAFAKHELLEDNKNKVESWKKVLVDASNIAGWEPKHVANGHEAKCIQEIVNSILGKLSWRSRMRMKSLNPVVEDKELVGMGTRLKYLKSRLNIGSGGVRMIGIWGLGGGGKTTLATSLYLESSGLYDGCCFVDNIREVSRQQNGLKKLQRKVLSAIFGKKMQVESVDIGKQTIERMLCHRKVLIVLDDVDHLDQLKALAGSHAWFGDKSLIIITTRDQHLLITHKVDEVCPVSLLSEGEAFRLFRRHAYNPNNPVEDYEKLSLLVIYYVKGLPLALKILGAFLYGKDKDEWLSTLDRLKHHPEMDIVEKLKISYDGLTLVEKELFLDIACFFRRQKKSEAMEIFDACGFHPRIGIKVLIQKALITISMDGQFDMHDLVQEMGHYIVRGQHPYNPEEHSRVWRKEDIEDICSMNATMENNKIEAIPPGVWSSNFIMFVSSMKKLRFLKVSTTSFDKGPSFLSNELRYIYWNGYPASLFPENFQPRKLVVLKMEFGLQKELWKGYKYLPCLKEMELFNMKALVRIPDIGGLQCLQKLILDKCESLEEIHQSLGSLSSLAHVSVTGCKKLKRFPTIVRMDKLRILEISECKALIEYPKIEAKLDNLVEFSLVNVGIDILASTIGEYCTKLSFVGLADCSKLKGIDDNFHALKGPHNFQLYGDKQIEMLRKDLFNENLDGLGLRKLDLSGCGLNDGDIPSEIGELYNLRELHLWSNDFTRLDFNLSRLTRLKLLDLGSCENLIELPELPVSLAILKADWCGSLEDIKDDAHRRCKWLCEVSVRRGRYVTGGDILLESVLQGKALNSGCMILQLKELEIPWGFEPRVVRGDKCRMQLPENWYNHFCGFLFCATSHGYIGGPIVSMKHVEKSMGGSMEMGVSQDDEYVYSSEEETDDDDDDDDDVYWEVEETETCVTYFPFSLLRHTSWWDPTSTAVEMEFHNSKCPEIRMCGLKLVQRSAESSSGQNETTPTHSSFCTSSDDNYKCKLDILHDSKSVFSFRLSNFVSGKKL
uniref:TMV resistance protein N-like isoform X2 n=1 Tax=Erigeron canadensis TaxID=72917 RepID=UPI001CB8E920|nr:TMV resistance protein N-like isoform X2 [Erigeron canadensis]